MKFEERFERLNQLLVETDQWWQFGAFHPSESRWCQTAPSLHKQLEKAKFGYDNFESSQLKSLEDLLAELIPQLIEIETIIDLPRYEQTMQAPTSHWQYQIAGRKWSQITRFVPHLPKDKQLLEWCAGKGHLGRLAASRGAISLTSLEWQKDLCEKNSSLNQRLNMEEDFCHCSVIQRDVLSNAPMPEYTSEHFAIALHACGDLHTQLIRRMVKTKATGICLAPCCYNLIEGNYYRPLSDLAKRSKLVLSKLDLSLPLRQTVTAGTREKTEQKRERLWRIGFDCWQRLVLDKDEYMPLPTIPKKILKGDFKCFAEWAASRKGTKKLIDNTQKIDTISILKQAECRLPAIAQMEWVQNHFQRAIEVWLVLDQVLYLKDNGYTSELFEFCEKSSTPRNILLKSIRRKN